MSKQIIDMCQDMTIIVKTLSNQCLDNCQFIALTLSVHCQDNV